MLEHQLETFVARLFAQACEQRNIAADECLQRSADRAEDRSRAYHDSPDDAEIADDAIAVQCECGGRHGVFHSVSPACVASIMERVLRRWLRSEAGPAENVV